LYQQIRKALPGDSEKYLGTIVGLATGNPYLGAIAGGVGSGMEGAIGGGLTGFQKSGYKRSWMVSSEGIRGFLGGREIIWSRLKQDPLTWVLGDIFSRRRRKMNLKDF
jgi:hypothetical protein